MHFAIIPDFLRTLEPYSETFLFLRIFRDSSCYIFRDLSVLSKVSGSFLSFSEFFAFYSSEFFKNFGDFHGTFIYFFGIFRVICTYMHFAFIPDFFKVPVLLRDLRNSCLTLRNFKNFGDFS